MNAVSASIPRTCENFTLKGSKEAFKVAGLAGMSQSANGVYQQKGTREGRPYFEISTGGMFIYCFSCGTFSRWCITPQLGGTGDSVWAFNDIDHCSTEPPQGPWSLRESSGATGFPFLALLTQAQLSGAGSEVVADLRLTDKCAEEALAGCEARWNVARATSLVLRALEASNWDWDKALSVLRLHNYCSENNANRSSLSGSQLTESDCVQILQCVNFDVQQAQSLLEVWRRYPRVPLAGCAEALKRSHWHSAKAGELLRGLQTRVESVVARIAATSSPSEAQLGHVGGVPRCVQETEVAEIAQLAISAYNDRDWNPAMVSLKAEKFAFGVMQVRHELKQAERVAREAALKTVHMEGSEVTEARLAGAFEVLDVLERFGPGPQEILAALHKMDMEPRAAAIHLMPDTLRGVLGLPNKGTKALLPPKPDSVVLPPEPKAFMTVPVALQVPVTVAQNCRSAGTHVEQKCGKGRRQSTVDHRVINRTLKGRVLV